MTLSLCRERGVCWQPVPVVMGVGKVAADDLGVGWRGVDDGWDWLWGARPRGIANLLVLSFIIDEVGGGGGLLVLDVDGVKAKWKPPVPEEPEVALAVKGPGAAGRPELNNVTDELDDGMVAAATELAILSANVPLEEAKRADRWRFAPLLPLPDAAAMPEDDDAMSPATLVTRLTDFSGPGALGGRLDIFFQWNLVKLNEGKKN